MASDFFGRPAMYKTAKSLANKITEYMNNCPDTRPIVLKDAEGATYIEYVPCYTICGLALYLGFESRQSFYDYGKRADFSYIVKKARFFIECQYEKMLHNVSCTGAIFALKNMKWYDVPPEDKHEENGITLEGVVANKNAISSLLMPQEGDNGTGV